MKRLFSYLLSKNKSIYLEIAKRHNSSPINVYALAHGKKARSNKDYDIIQSLIDKGIVSGYRTI